MVRVVCFQEQRLQLEVILKECNHDVVADIEKSGWVKSETYKSAASLK